MGSLALLTDLVGVTAFILNFPAKRNA